MAASTLAAREVAPAPMPAVHLVLRCLLMVVASSAEPRFASLIKGVSYGPVPLTSTEGGSRLPQDDWMAAAAKPMWGSHGRADLQVIKSLGANMVRLYGNNPLNDHSGFLDEAYTNDLQVAPGMSDWPYFQNPNHTMPETPCKFTDYNCYVQVKLLYAKNLKNGFLLSDGSYHPSLAYMNIINEPDLKMPTTTNIRGPEGPKQMCRAIISAFDGMLDAEKEAGMQGVGVNFTVTFSYAVCKPCIRFNTHPALGQMAQLADAMQNPEKYGYSPRNNLAEAYRTRWTHSFNTQNKAEDLPIQFMNTYEQEFTTTPVYIGEYHNPHVNATADLVKILDVARTSGVFLGISFFQYQKAYWKGGTEMEFGMFDLGSTSLATMAYFGNEYEVLCMVPSRSPSTGTTIPKAVANAYGGAYLDPDELCIPSPESVSIDGAGFGTISEQGKASRMATFVTRVLQHLGGFPVERKGLEAFAAQFVGVPESAFGSVVGFLVQRPRWAQFDPAARCVSDRNAYAGQVGDAIGYVCSNATLQQLAGINCSEAPAPCADNVFNLGDWVFSHYYYTVRSPNPLQDCSFNGAAMYASSAYYSEWSPECVARPELTAASMRPAIPFTPFNPRRRTLEPLDTEISMRQQQELGVLQTAPMLGVAGSPGLQVAQASGHGAPGFWWGWLVLIGAIVGCVGCGAYSSSKHMRKRRKEAAEFKENWFQGKRRRLTARLTTKLNRKRRGVDAPEDAPAVEEARQELLPLTVPTPAQVAAPVPVAAPAPVAARAPVVLQPRAGTQLVSAPAVMAGCPAPMRVAMGPPVTQFPVASGYSVYTPVRFSSR